MEIKAYLRTNGRIGNANLKSGDEVTVLNAESKSDIARVSIDMENGATQLALIPKDKLLLDLGNMDWVFALNSEF
jgi:hypothetical protein